jgi:8-oxo-dGTP diphosphatase
MSLTDGRAGHPQCYPEELLRERNHGHVRLSVKAIITQHGRLLVLKNRDSVGEWFMLPGGGQEHGETIPAALNRECLEEIGSEVIVGPLRFIRDYIAKHHEFDTSDGGAHQVELMFECKLTSAPGPGTIPDAMQTGIEWLELSTLTTTASIHASFSGCSRRTRLSMNPFTSET